MRMVLDGTPLLGTRSGIGQYVAHLLAAMAPLVHEAGAELAVTTWTWRGGRIDGLPDGVVQVGGRVPARVLRTAWRRGGFPPIELLVGATDVVHGTNFVCPPSRRARQVVTVHDLTYLPGHPGAQPHNADDDALVRRALDRGAHVITPSTSTAEAVVAHYALEPARVSVTPLGVAPPWFDARPPEPEWLASHHLPQDYLVFVGSRDPRKNLPRLLRAHQAARAADPQVPTLVLAGPGTPNGLSGISVDAMTTGYLPVDELRSLVAGARALVIPSLDEGFGLPVLEAMATGTAVVAADIAALHEVGGPHACYVGPTDDEALAHALVEVSAAGEDPGARAARRVWARTFTWERCARATLDAYAVA